MNKALDQKTLAYFPIRIIDQVKTPCYLISEDVLHRNGRILSRVREQAGVKILLALKAFALPAVFPLLSRYLSGVCASGPIEARLGREEFGGQVHTYAPAYTPSQMARVLTYSDHVIFNSMGQWNRYKEQVNQKGKIKAGLRVNPGHAEVKVDLYNPCLPGSRFGVSAKDLEGADLSGITGLHFHALCEQGANVLVRVLESFEDRFKPYIQQMEWINLGGGHHITRSGYDIDLLCDTINRFRRQYHVDVYLEPGEAVVLDAGVFVTSVADIIHNDLDIAVLDCSAETHMPDVLAMPYRPHILGSGTPEEFAHTFRLGGISCLAGDIIGDYSFAAPLRTGERLVLTDMALYTFVKNTTFNGVELPAIYTFSGKDDSPRLVKSFGYDDYLGRIK